MTDYNLKTNTGQSGRRKFGCLQVFGIVTLTIIVTVGITLWVAKTYIFPSQFKPVTLTSQEEQQLSAKLSRFDFSGDNAWAQTSTSQKTTPQNKDNTDTDDLNAPITPQAYSEKGASREIIFTERELNAMLAKKYGSGYKMAIDLEDNLISARLRIPVDRDFPIFGGKTLRAATGLELAYRQEKPVVILKGVKLMGVPIPNAWLGGLKNIDLVKEFGDEEGFWKLFSDGVESIEVKNGRLNITLKE